MHALVTWFLHVTGSDDGSGAWYLWWSGFVGDLAIFAAVILAARRLNCHAHRCWRIGIHRVDGTPYVTCRRHHPTTPLKRVTADHIMREHARVHAESSSAPRTIV